MTSQSAEQKIDSLNEGEATTISGDEFDAPGDPRPKPKGWKNDRKAKNKEARQARRRNR